MLGITGGDKTASVAAGSKRRAGIFHGDRQALGELPIIAEYLVVITLMWTLRDDFEFPGSVLHSPSRRYQNQTCRQLSSQCRRLYRHMKRIDRLLVHRMPSRLNS